QQPCGAFGVGGVVAGRRVARHAHQLAQECDGFVKTRVDEIVEGMQDFAHRGWKFSRKWSSTEVAMPASSALIVSSGLWLMPPLPQRTKSIAIGAAWASSIASCPAPLGSRRT